MRRTYRENQLMVPMMGDDTEESREAESGEPESKVARVQHEKFECFQREREVVLGQTRTDCQSGRRAHKSQHHILEG